MFFLFFSPVRFRLVFGQDAGGGWHGDTSPNAKMWEDALRQTGRLEEPGKHFAQDGFTVLPKVMQLWYTMITQMYHDLVDREQGDVFRKYQNKTDGSGDKVIDDPHRKITDIREDRLLWSLIVTPVTQAMGSLGFLDIDGTPEGGMRVSRDGSYLRSLDFEDPQQILLEGLQGFHTEGNPRNANNHGIEYALYTLTAGAEGAEVHLYPGHMGGDPMKYGGRTGGSPFYLSG